MRRSRFVVAVIVVTALVGGCAYDWSFPGGVDPSIDGGGGDSAKDTSTNEASPPPDQFTPDGPIPTGSCKDNSNCKATEYCHFADQLCGLGVLGVCREPEPGPTCMQNRRVCTCAGNMFDSSCLASMKREDFGSSPLCNKNDGASFLCGFIYCKNNAEICVVTKATGTPVYTCESIATCGPPTKCSCSEPNKYVTVSGCECAEDGNSAVIVTCK